MKSDGESIRETFRGKTDTKDTASRFLIHPQRGCEGERGDLINPGV